MKPRAGDRVELRGGQTGRVVGVRDGGVVIEIYRDALQVFVTPEEIERYVRS